LDINRLNKELKDANESAAKLKTLAQRFKTASEKQKTELEAVRFSLYKQTSWVMLSSSSAVVMMPPFVP
jgi:hypothetical protein